MNTQDPQQKEFRTDGKLVVHSIFHTIQGEGPFTGSPAIFIRLAGCNLQCPGCDTIYTTERDSVVSPEEILQTMAELTAFTPSLVVITGGEPFRQDITGLCYQLLEEGFTVQVETNGTLPPPSVDFKGMVNLNFNIRNSAFIICSPKSGRINKQLEPLIGAYKYVLRDGDDYGDGLPASVLGNECNVVARPPNGFRGPIYVQPEDQHDKRCNENNLKEAITSCMKYGYTLQLQIHKLIGVE